MAGVFNFCPGSLVPETLVPEQLSVMSLNGWTFSAKPNVPYQKSFKVTLHGLRWYLNADGTFDRLSDRQHNARVLEEFYEKNGTWDSFDWFHPHFGNLKVRFKALVQIPAAISNSGGLCNPLEITLIHHNPGYT